MTTVVAFAPVLIYLAILMAMDSFKLARPATIARAMACGAAAAVACALLHAVVAPLVPLSAPAFSRYVAPLTEETAKAAFIAYVIARRQVGFSVDAAQVGFAVGTAFALVENVWYLQSLSDGGLALWVARGVGTAVLHGATTAVLAMMALTAAHRHPQRGIVVLLPGWLSAVAMHSAFNHVLLPPVMTAAVLLIALSLIVLWVFERSERATREWVGGGLDLDLVLLEIFSSDGGVTTRFGRYLQELRARFPGAVVADMLCLLRVELELSIQAKSVLLARDAGVAMPVHPDAPSAIAEVKYLRASIGPTGLLALRPIDVTTHRDDWHRYLLAGAE